MVKSNPHAKAGNPAHHSEIDGFFQQRLWINAGLVMIALAKFWAMPDHWAAPAWRPMSRKPSTSI
jgi:hypothetical protein